MSGTDLAYGFSSLRDRYAMSGTELAYGGTGRMDDKTRTTECRAQVQSTPHPKPNTFDHSLYQPKLISAHVFTIGLYVCLHAPARTSAPRRACTDRLPLVLIGGTMVPNAGTGRLPLKRYWSACAGTDRGYAGATSGIRSAASRASAPRSS
eukprot:992749-Rhodomonas_salina.1